MNGETNRLLTIVSWTAFIIGALIGILLLVSAMGIGGRPVRLLGICGFMLIAIGYLARQLINTNRRVEILEKRLASLAPLEV